MSRQSQRGAALIVAILMLSLLAILGGAILTSATIELRIGDNYASRMQSRYLAEAGIEAAREKLRKSTASLSFLLAKATDGAPFLEMSGVEGRYRVWLRNDVADGADSTVDTNQSVALLSIAQS